MKPKLRISYWTYPRGNDFLGIDDFEDELSAEFDLEIISQETDALGNGLHELVLEIYNNINSTDFVKEYARDLVKVGVGAGTAYLAKHVFQGIKNLFSKNEKLTPGFELVKLIFRDVTVFIYPLYLKSISTAIDALIDKLPEHFPEIVKGVDSSILEIHVPIFNQADSYEICDYRVRLNVDENIPKFTKADYFKIWGIKCVSGNNFVYDLHDKKSSLTKFYTQAEYDVLFDEWYNRNNLQ